MTEPLDLWNPFDCLLERDSSRAARAEIAIASPSPLVPVVGVIPVEPEPEFPDRAMHDVANDAIRRLLSQRDVSIIEIDTRLPMNLAGLRSAAEVESLIARTDLVLTTRLHGLVLALKNGVPAIAIDPNSGGSKVWQQAQTIGWPVAFNPDNMKDRQLSEAFDYCLTKAARTKAKECADGAIEMVEGVRREFIEALGMRG